MSAKRPIKDRITDALKANGGRMQYYHLARAVFPRDQYPRAFSHPTKGGPPGCYMALSRAIDKHGFKLRFDPDPRSRVVHSVISLPPEGDT
jgi:hypothetical protein